MKFIYIFIILCLVACAPTKKIADNNAPVSQEIVPERISPLVPVIETKTHGFSMDRLSVFDKYLNTEIEANRIPGAVLMISQNGEEVYHKSYGEKEKASGIPMPKNELFYIQSMTKPIISIAFMMLYEEGHFHLNDPVNKYLPQFADLKVATEINGDHKVVDAESDITISQLLSHTAGLSHGLGSSDLDKKYLQALYFQQHADIEARVNVLPNLPLVGQPGKQWYYSASPDVISLLIEKFSGMSTAEFLQQRIFGPLEMNDTGYNIAAGSESRKAVLYNTNPDMTLAKSERQSPANGHTIFGGTHGLFSSASDYMKFCQMLLNNGQANGHQFIGRKTLQLMTTNHLSDDITYEAGQGFGLGFGIITDLAKSKALASEGTYAWGGAFNTYFFIDPEENLAAVLMMQFNPYTNHYADKLRQFVYQALVD